MNLIKNREGYLVSETHRQCTNCQIIFEKSNETVMLCPKCNSGRVKQTSPEKKMLARAKSRAKISNIEFNLSIEDIIIPKICPIMKIELISHSGRSGGKKNSPSLDRINPSIGYISSNVWVISHLANQMKSHATEEELKMFAEWIVNRQ